MAQLLLLGKGIALICAALALCYLIPQLPVPVDYTALAEQKIEQFKKAASLGTSFLDLLCKFCGESWRAWSVQLLGFEKYLDVEKTKLALEGATLVKSMQESPSPVTFMSSLCQRQEIHEKVVSLLQSGFEWCCKSLAVVGGEIIAWSLVFFWTVADSKTALSTKTGRAVVTAAVNSTCDVAPTSATHIRVPVAPSAGESSGPSLPANNCADTGSAGLGDDQASTSPKSPVKNKNKKKKQDAPEEQRTDTLTHSPAMEADQDFGDQQARMEELRSQGKKAIRRLWAEIIAASFVARLTFSTILPVVDMIRDKRLEVNSVLRCVFHPSTAALKDMLLLPGVSAVLGDQAEVAREALAAVPDMELKGLPEDGSGSGIKLLSWLSYFTGLESLDTVLRTIVFSILGTYLCWCSCRALRTLRPFLGKLRATGGNVVKSTAACLSRLLVLAIGSIGFTSQSTREYAMELASEVPMAQAAIERAMAYLQEGNRTVQVDWQSKAYDDAKRLQSQAWQALADVHANAQRTLSSTLEHLSEASEDVTRCINSTVQPLLSSCGLQHVQEILDFRMFSTALAGHDWSTELYALLATLVHERIGMVLMQPYFQSGLTP